MVLLPFPLEFKFNKNTQSRFVPRQLMNIHNTEAKCGHGTVSCFMKLNVVKEDKRQTIQQTSCLINVLLNKNSERPQLLDK